MTSERETTTVTYEPAEGNEYDVFLRLMEQHASDYLNRTLTLMEITWESFAHLFNTVGEVYGIYEDGRLAGFYWVEKRDAVLHLHGLILKEGFRGRGIGSRVLRDLEARHSEGVATIELGVHASNRGARRLYERLGYDTVKHLEELGFEIMQKEVSDMGLAP